MANLITKGLSRGTVEELSRQKGEPEWMLQKRLHAWDVYEKTPAPLGLAEIWVHGGQSRISSFKS